MNNSNSVLSTGVINLELWNKASWKAIAFLSDQTSAPYIGIVYQNESAAKKIFKEWIDRFGKHDKYDEIRVSLVEGDIEGEEYGYTVHISSSTDNMIKKCRENNLNPENTKIVLLSRYLRMNPERHSKNLEVFKDEYKRFLSYKLIPVYLNSDNQLIPYFDLEIEKREIFFRNITDIDSKDLDSVVFSSIHGK